MGTLHYGSQSYKVEDRMLAHLQVLIGLKLRRGESFFLSWAKAAADGGGRNAVWIDNGVPIACEYSGSRMPSIQREWVEAMSESAGSNLGLEITENGEIVPRG